MRQRKVDEHMPDDNNGPGPIGIILIPVLLGLLAYLLWDAGVIR